MAGIQFSPTKEQFLFGIFEQPFSTPSNYLILHLKKYIWKSKFQQTNNLSLVGFKNYFGNVLDDLKMLYELENNSAEFHVWNDRPATYWPPPRHSSPPAWPPGWLSAGYVPTNRSTQTELCQCTTVTIPLAK